MKPHEVAPLTLREAGAGLLALALGVLLCAWAVLVTIDFVVVSKALATSLRRRSRWTWRFMADLAWLIKWRFGNR